MSAESACRASAQRIAREFAELVRAGHAAGDMVVLLGRMTNADVYARALRAEGLPCVISGGSVFARTAEAGAVRELVRVVANPLESESLLNVLTGPLCSLSAGDLLQAGGLSGFWHAVDEREDAASRSPQLECALRVMAHVRDGAGRAPTSRIVGDAIVESGWLSRLQEQGPEGLAGAGNVYKALRMIRKVEREGACGPVTTMRRFEETLAGSKEAPGALSVSGGNSVRIMTVHASKGLEFPIVAVAEIKEDRPPSGRLLTAAVAGKTYLSLDLGRSIEARTGAVDVEAVSEYVLGLAAGEDELARAVAEDAGALHRRLALREYVATGDAEEAKRLLYVALTRAKEALVVSSAGKTTKSNPVGLPASALVGVFQALDSTGAAFGQGCCSLDFGGSCPAAVECVLLDADDGADEPCAQASDEPPELFSIPAADTAALPARETWRPLHDATFSYSSIADAAHEGDVLGRLARSFAVSADEAVGEADAFEAGSAASPLRFPFGGDDPESFDVSRAFDEDRATDLGTAFHRLAQYSVAARAESSGMLERPPRERIAALARTCRLDQLQQERLMRALERWLASDVARDMEALPQLGAEVPFFVGVPIGTGERAYLEGEIDLLGFDAAGTHAHVVDYKTGGHDGESPDELKRKHVLQAACYAYAVLLQGAAAVDAVFVRVERAAAGGQPQCVRYRFCADDLPVLEQAIGQVYGRC